MKLYKRPRSPFWYMDVMVGGKRKRISLKTANKEIAETIAAKVYLDVRDYRPQKTDDKTTFSKLIDVYLAFSKTNKAKSTAERDEIALKNFQSKMQIASPYEITLRKMQEYIEQRKQEGITNRTINIETGTIKHLLNKAIEWGYVKYNAIEKLKKLKEADHALRFFSKSEIKTMLKAAEGMYLHNIILFALNTGMRLSEIINLEWSAIDTQNNMIIVGKDYKTKGNKVRYIPINDTVKSVLEEQKGSRQYVFETQDGKPRKNNLGRDFRRLLRQCEIPNASFHTLRHTFASYLAMSGESLLTVKELLGHSQISTTMIYAHLSDEHKRNAVKKLKF